LADPHYNVTEVLAGAPQLVARYKRASEEQQAVLNAAIDARRLGTQAPLTGALLCAAARGYLSTLHPDDTWFSPALTELTRDDRQQDHATAPLIPVLNEEKAKVLGYTVADYLMQHVSQERRSVRVPASTWDAFLSHVPDPADTARLANSARNRLLYRYAIPLYRPAADAGDRYAASRLAGLLANRDDLDELRDLDDLDDLYDLDELRGRADADGWYAAIRLAGLLADRGDLDELRGRADAGDPFAGQKLAGLLADRGDLDELRGRVDVGDPFAGQKLPGLLEKQGRGEEAERLRRFGLNPDGSIARA
jgi:hypothetical protein